MTRRVSQAIRAEARRLRVQERLSAPQIAKRVGISNATAYKILEKVPGPVDHTSRVGKRATWSSEEVEVLKRLWPVASEEDLKAALPRRNLGTMGKKASSLKITRPSAARRHPERKVHPLISQLVQARFAQKMTIRSLAEKSGHHPVETHEWEMGKKPMRLLTFIDLANALGFDVVLRPKLQAVATPDMKRLMGSR